MLSIEISEFVLTVISQIEHGVSAAGVSLTNMAASASVAPRVDFNIAVEEVAEFEGGKPAESRVRFTVFVPNTPEKSSGDSTPPT